MPETPTVHSPSPGHTSVGLRLLDTWTHEQDGLLGAAEQRIADACGVSSKNANHWRLGTRPVPTKHREAILALTGIDPAAWETWEKLGPDEPAAPPESGPREVVLPDLGSTPNEIRASVRRALALLTEKEITVKQRLDAEGRIQVGLATLARLEERASLEDHPEFASKLGIILDALDATLRQYGIEPVGAREAFVAHVDALEKRIARAA